MRSTLRSFASHTTDAGAIRLQKDGDIRYRHDVLVRVLLLKPQHGATIVRFIYAHSEGAVKQLPDRRLDFRIAGEPMKLFSHLFMREFWLASLVLVFRKDNFRHLAPAFALLLSRAAVASLFSLSTK